MNNVIPDTIFDKAGEVAAKLASHRRANDKAHGKVIRASLQAKTNEERRAFDLPEQEHQRLHDRLSSLLQLVGSAESLAVAFGHIKEDPTGDFTALATEYGDLMTRITEAVAKAHDAIDK